MEGIPPEDIKEHEKQKTGIKNHNFPATDMIIECTLYTVCIQILFSNNVMYKLRIVAFLSEHCIIALEICKC